jgi:hypothetical protein
VESITIFWLAVPAVNLLAQRRAGPDGTVTHPNGYDWLVYASLLVLTPGLLLLKFWSEAPRNREGRLPRLGEWPIWKAVAATVSFALWALAVPGNPFMTTTDLLMIMWVVAAVVSVILGYVDKGINRPPAGP